MTPTDKNYIRSDRVNVEAERNKFIARHFAVNPLVGYSDVQPIAYCVQEESSPVDDEDEDNNNNESSKGTSNADACSALETAMEWYEKQPECCPTQLLLLKRTRDLVQLKNKGVQWCRGK
ncbi:hypothetical protein TNCV_3291281 [Trichonephila clavipes]|nr:hypothetical protein TNCV_3291281 [Trichonephila clavipes]